MKAVDWAQALATDLEGRGLMPFMDQRSLESYARGLAGTTAPLRLLALWLERCPEARVVFDAILEATMASPVADGRRDAATVNGVAVVHEQRAAASPDAPKAPRRVTANDLAGELGSIGKLDLYAQRVLAARGKNLFVACVGVGDIRRVHVIDVAGLVILAIDHATGSRFQIPILSFHPDARDVVTEIVRSHPRYASETSFNPWRSYIDPWSPAMLHTCTGLGYPPTDYFAIPGDPDGAEVTPLDEQPVGQFKPTNLDELAGRSVQNGYMQGPCNFCGKALMVRSGGVARCDGCGTQADVTDAL